MSEQAPGGTSAEPEPGVRPEPGTVPEQPSPPADPVRIPQMAAPAVRTAPMPHKYRVVSSADLPSFSTHTPIVAGTIIWLVLVAVAILGYDRLDAHGNGWWLWMAVSGVVLGSLGWLYVAVRKPDQSGRPEQSSHLDR